jgi:hypothetical protein
MPESVRVDSLNASRSDVLIIACGALAREITALKRQHGWDHVHLQCLDARLHNHPQQIPLRLREKIRQNRNQFEHIFVAYADCGTAGAIDKVLSEEAIERLPGAHCYEFFAGSDRFAELCEEEPGTFYLTDFLARNFEQLVIRPLKMDQYPQLRDQYFAHYERLVYLAQTHSDALLEKARNAAHRLGLRFEHRHCGYGELESGLKLFIQQGRYGQENADLLA